MARLTEKLDGGLVDSPDPMTLKPGQLSNLTNAVYRAGDQALHRARGRTTFGTATASAGDVNGLRNMQFDNADHYLVAQVSCAAVANYSTAVVGDTGTWGVLTTAVTAGTQLEAIHYNNRYYLMNGTVAGANTQGPNTQWVAYLAASGSATGTANPVVLRQHGMVAVSATNPTATASSAFAASASGFYEYWTTEVLKYTQDGIQDEIEGTFGGTPLTVYVSSTSVAPVIQRPTLVNASATHWRVYRSPIKVFSTDRSFPDGFQVAEQTTGVTSITDTSSATLGSYQLPAGIWKSTAWGNPTRVTAADGSFATVTAIVYPATYNALLASGFNFGGFQGPVIGIEVQITAYATAGTNAAANVWLAKKGNPVGSPVFLDVFAPPMGAHSFTVTSTNSGSPDVVTLGGATDRWVLPSSPGFVDTDFTADFLVGLINAGPLGVDAIKVRVYYGAGQSEASIRPFPTVVYTFGDIVSEVGKNGSPPSSSTGDIFQDCLVVNDVTAPKIVRYSFPGSVDYFPSTYYLGFQTKDNDQVTCIRVVNSRLVILLGRSAWRANYLPSERDASFDRGKAIEPISETYGCINSMCACVFSMDSSTQLLAWVSQKGIHVTDGFSFSTLTDDLEWRNVLSLTSTSQAIALINDPEQRDLLFYYRNDALGNDSYECVHLNYDRQHVLSEQKLKISGKVKMRNYNAAAGSARADLKSAWTVPRNSGDTGVYLGYGSATAAGGGMVYRETGTTIPAEDPNMRFMTRRMFLAGESNEWTANEIYAYVGSNTSTAGIDLTLLTVKTNDDAGEVTKSTNTVAFAGRKHGKYEFRQIAEGLRISANASGNPNNDIAVEHLVIDGENFGIEDSGK